MSGNLPVAHVEEGNLPLSDDVARSLLANQVKQMDLRAIELANEQQQADLIDKHRTRIHEYALKSLDATERQDQRQSEESAKGSKRAAWIFGMVIVTIAAFALSALFLGREQILTQLLQLAIVGGGGAGAGYVGGYSKGRKEGGSQPDESVTTD